MLKRTAPNRTGGNAMLKRIVHNRTGGNAMLKRTVPVLTFALALSMSSAGYALDDDETEVELSGTIASVNCPSSLIVETASGPITVNTTDEDGEAAEIDDEATNSEVTCGDLVVGSRVEAKGDYDASTKIVTADEIGVNGDADETCHEDDIEVLELSGKIKKVNCPSITVRTSTGRVVVTTTDEDGDKADIEDEALDRKVACKRLKVGDEFEVKEGELDASTGKVTADEISVNDDQDMCTDG
ncbi:MAG: hypothetical protein ACREYF_14200 [Gammaproteobacteria bacterium]